jgi:hypothetical protein
MQEQHKELVYIPAERASKRIGVITQTLRGWAAAGKIGFVVTPGGRFRYAFGAFLAKQALERERVQAELAKKKATSRCRAAAALSGSGSKKPLDAGDRARYTSSLDPWWAVSAKPMFSLGNMAPRRGFEPLLPT